MIRQEQCDKVCRILDDVLANRPTERDSLIVAVQKAFEALEQAETNCSEIPNNSDTISRQAVTKFLNDWLSCLFENCHKQSASDLKMIIKDFKNLPSTQPEIIRCKDCAYCDSDVVNAPYGMTEKVWWCDRLYAGANENLVVNQDDFCSWAERRE